MSQPGKSLMSIVLLGTALVTLLLGLYFLLADGNTVLGGALIAVSLTDAALAAIVSRKRS
jgi:hypothetical protein